jgi:hypothetical protein
MPKRSDPLRAYSVAPIIIARPVRNSLLVNYRHLAFSYNSIEELLNLLPPIFEQQAKKYHCNYFTFSAIAA